MKGVILCLFAFSGSGLWGASLLSFYLGVSSLADGTFVEEFCGDQSGKSAAPLNVGEPLLLNSTNIEGPAINPQVFRVVTTQGKLVTPTCASLEPAYGANKNMTILLVGEFGNQGATPASVQVVGDLWTTDGLNLKSKMIGATIPTALNGVKLVQARLQLPSNLPDKGGCPQGTTHIIMLVFEGGVTGALNSPLGETQRLGTFLQFRESVGGRVVIREANPNALAGDFDNDNYVNACFSLPGLNSSWPLTVKIKPNIYFDPANRPNPLSAISVRSD